MNEGMVPATVIPSATVLAGILINNHRISDLNQSMAEHQQQINVRFDSLEKLFDEKLPRVEQVVDARLARIEDQRKIR